MAIQYGGGTATPVEAVDASHEVQYSDSELVSVHVRLPKVLWRAVDSMARFLGTSKTNVVVRALNKEAYFVRLQMEDPQAQVFVKRSDGRQENVIFV